MTRTARHALALIFLLLAALPTAAPAAHAADSASATVERLNAALLEVMQQAETLGYAGRYDRLAPDLKQIFDFPTMARIALGGHWSSISSAQQEAFTQAFTGYSIGVFANRFNGRRLLSNDTR